MEDTVLYDKQTNTVSCPVCGVPNPADSQFCFACGRQMAAPTMSFEEPIPAPVFAAEPPQKAKRPVVGIVITAIIAALLLGACGYLVYDDFTLRKQLTDANTAIEKLEKTESAQKDTIQEQKTEIEKITAEKDATIAEKDAAIEELKVPAGYIDQILQNPVAGKNEKTFYVDDNLLVLKMGETAKLTLYTDWENGGVTNIAFTTDAAKIDFDSTVYEGNTATLTVTPKHVGATLATFTNTVDSSTFQVFVIVTE